MKKDKNNSKTKKKVVRNTRTKGSGQSKQSKNKTRVADGGLKCKKTCRQITASKQNSPQNKARKTKKLDVKKMTKTRKTKKKDDKKAKKTEKTKTQDAKKVRKSVKTQDNKDKKCTAYISVELPEKDLRSILRNFSDKVILNMPSLKQRRIREVQCKVAGYETKKRKILKIVSQPGEKREEILHTANTLQKMKEEKTVKPKLSLRSTKSVKEKRKRSPMKLSGIERKQTKKKKAENPSIEDTISNNSADPIGENERKSKEDTEDPIRLSFPINTGASQSVNAVPCQPPYNLLSNEISKPSTTIIKYLTPEPLKFNPLTSEVQIKGSTDTPAYQQISSSLKSPSVIFLNNTLSSENCNATLGKNQSPAVQQIPSTQQPISIAFSSHIEPGNAAPAVEYAPSLKKSETWPFSNEMHLNGFREDTLNNLLPAFELVSARLSSAHAPSARNATTIGCGGTTKHNETIESESPSSLLQPISVSSSNVVPLNVYNESETKTEITNINKNLCSNQSSVKGENQSITRDYLVGRDNLLSHVTGMDDLKRIELDAETIYLSSISSDLSNLRLKIQENIKEKESDAVQDQNVPPCTTLSSNEWASRNNPEYLEDNVNSTVIRMRYDDCNAENGAYDKNEYNFKFSAPIYNYIDFIPSYSETASSPDTSNSSEVPMDNCIISNSSPTFNCDVRKADLATCGLTYGLDTSKNHLLAFSEENRSFAKSNESNTTVNLSSESILSQQSSSDSCLVTSSSTDDEGEENVEHTSSVNRGTLQTAAVDSDICEEYSTNVVCEDLDLTQSKVSLESILSQTALISSKDEVSRENKHKSDSTRGKPQRKSFENGSLYWLQKAKGMRKNYSEATETIPSRNCSYDSLVMKYFMSSISHEKGRSKNRGEFSSGSISKSKHNHRQE